MYLFSFLFGTKKEEKLLSNLSKDELFSIAMKLDLQSLLKFSLVNKRINEKISDVWKHKIQKFSDNSTFNVQNDKSKYILLYCLTILKQKLKINKDIYEIYNLETLDLNGKQLREIPKEVGVLTNLKNIYLVDNYIRILPTQFFNLINLEEIYLSNNGLEEIPDDINRLINLKKLFLRKNYIKVFPKLEKLTKLHSMCLSKNLIEEIPSDIIRLTSLERLYLHDNRIKNLPKELENMPNLKVLTFMKNSTEHISDKIKSLNAFTLYK